MMVLLVQARLSSSTYPLPNGCRLVVIIMTTTPTILILPNWDHPCPVLRKRRLSTYILIERIMLMLFVKMMHHPVEEGAL